MTFTESYDKALNKAIGTIVAAKDSNDFEKVIKDELQIFNAEVAHIETLLDVGMIDYE